MNYLSDKAKSVIPYTPGEQPQNKKYIKLNTNENPYPPSPQVLKQIKEYDVKELRLYPDPENTALRVALAEREGVRPEQIFCSNGSDEVLAFCFQAFFNPEGLPVLFPDVTYSFYTVYADIFGIPYQTVPLDGQLRINHFDYCRANGGAIIANPNAPTGIYLSLEKLLTVIKYNLEKSLVILDEAYIEFGGQSGAPLIGDYPNLLIVRTLSKSHSLAGLRVGYAIGDEGLIAGLKNIKNSFNSYLLDRLACAGAVAAIRDESYHRETMLKITRTREYTVDRLSDLGFMIPDSKANFIFVSHPEVKAGELFAYLKEQGILVRYFDKPRIDNYLRISIGTDQEMDILVKQLERYLQKR
ncbi:MAG: histidinol-phosphate transaminase [Syntrophomonadaceae bacterium]|jgi:histidinol-phosphate aminotransferase|nr:histidinol-phosphate transaminase [Syntrophomonadaceae bacterium]